MDSTIPKRESLEYRGLSGVVGFYEITLLPNSILRPSKGLKCSMVSLVIIHNMRLWQSDLVELQVWQLNSSLCVLTLLGCDYLKSDTLLVFDIDRLDRFVSVQIAFLEYSAMTNDLAYS